MTTIQGIIHGKMIELDKEPGFPDGLAVTVTIQQLGNGQSKLSQPSPPLVESWCHRIVFDTAVSPTEKVVKGTRLIAEALVSELEQGRDDEELLKAHSELTEEDAAALRNYARTPVGVRRSFGAWAEEAEELDKYLEWNRQERRKDRPEIDG